MKSSAYESIKNGYFNLERLRRSSRLAWPGSSALGRLQRGFDYITIVKIIIIMIIINVERLYIPRKDGGRGLIEVETAFKIATIGLDHYLKNKDGQYPKQVLEHDKSKAKNSITKNACKFKGEVPISEFENQEDKSASENAKAVKNKIKSRMKSVKKEKGKNKALHGQYPKLLEKPHVDIVTTNK